MHMYLVWELKLYMTLYTTHFWMILIYFLHPVDILCHHTLMYIYTDVYFQNSGKFHHFGMDQ